MASNGPASGLEYDRDLQNVLHDVPSMNESNDVVHGGTPSHSKSASNSDNKFQPSVGSGSHRTVIPPTSLPASGQWNPPMPPANTNVPLSSPSPSQNGEDSRSQVTRPPQSKIDTLKQWSISTYKCTRQIISEKLGKGSRTVDSELECQIEQLRETQRKYANILRLARALASHFYHVVQTQHALAESFSDLAHKSPELQEEFLYNSETQRNLGKNGETLLGALNFFVSCLNTLCNKTIEDTLLTVKLYENARLEFDAYRSDLEELMQGTRGDAMSSKLDEARKNYTTYKEKYEKLRSDVAVKMKFLEENKVKVMHKQLLLFHNAVSAYFSGNQSMLESTLKQFNIKMKNPNSSSQSWLEQ
ncbi:arfaptin-2-like [Limulus polyphemus]|uniref:Arfaptin-2-like n=1 Tax=Limulus polyphemus TaxID=6850 RepID=A0ABM1BMG1_LIMPO|nr:arfaptin-2-like [Limulus polyphemus]XP_022253171.1 arfaptin-2-like [Limulus polyphemus]